MWERLWAEQEADDTERERADAVGRWWEQAILFWAVCIALGFIIGVVLAEAHIW